MNKLLQIVFLVAIVTTNIQAQIPDGYYDGTENKSGDDLKLALYQIIKTQIMKSYGDARYILDDADIDPDNENNVLVIYSPHSVSGTWDAGSTWNREHVWAKSRGIGDVDNGTKGAGSDLHNLRACIPDVNSYRSNRWFGEGDTSYDYNGEETGSFYGSTDWLWEPRDEDKGDVARIIFYMATRYEGDGNEPDLEVIDYIPEDKFTNDPVHALFSNLLEWHSLDPVSDFERNRNEVIYSYQQNRNPFIDHPEFVNKIWGGGNGVQETMFGEVKLYPNPANGILNIETTHSFESITIYNLLGKQVINKPFLTENNIDYLKGGHYIVKLNSENGKNISLPLVVQ